MQDVARLKSLSNDEVLEAGSRILRGNLSELYADAKPDAESVLEHWLTTMIRKGVEASDEKIFSVVMTRLLGRAPETKTLQGPNGGPIEFSDTRTDAEKIERAEALRRMRVALDE